MSSISLWLLAMLVPALLGTAAPSSVFAQEREYVGTWAAKHAQCRLGQQNQNAPLVLKRNRYDQHETHCTFRSVRPAGEGRWRVQARCSVEGDTQTHSFTFTVAGSSLSIRDQQGVRVLRRCG